MGTVELIIKISITLFYAICLPGLGQILMQWH